MDSDKKRAIETFQFYFKTAFEAAGSKWSSDNDAEIEDAVTAILGAASTSADDETEGAIARHEAQRHDHLA